MGCPGGKSLLIKKWIHSGDEGLGYFENPPSFRSERDRIAFLPFLIFAGRWVEETRPMNQDGTDG
jgi:hypothetical protein